MAEVTLSLPFSVDSYGKIKTASSASKIWADRVRSVIGTTVRERVMRDTFGTSIAYSVFSNSEDASTSISFETTDAFLKQLPLLKLSSVSSTFDEFTGIMQVEVVYDLPNNETVSTIIGLVELRGTAPFAEETL